MSFYCPHCGSPLHPRKNRDGETFWACQNRQGCNWTWDGDEERPRATGLYDGLKVGVEFMRSREAIRSAAGQLWPLYLEFVSRSEEAEDLLELGEIRRELREMKEGGGGS